MLTPFDEELIVGQKVADRYEILSVLGRGSMGIVYKARHDLMGRLVAIKMLRWQLLSDERSMKRFEREARAASRMDHPNIITVFDFGLTPKRQPYLVMDFARGINLYELMKTQDHMEPERAVHIFTQVCDALYHAHVRGVIHRDLKPANIMLMEKETDPDFVKVVDLGIAKIAFEDAYDSEALTNTGEVCGSPVYLSPEQCKHEPLDPRSDIYALGVVMYEVLTGRAPLMGETVYDTLYLHVHALPPAFADIRPDLRIPKRLEEIVLKCLSKDPANRYQTMQELRYELQAALQPKDAALKVLGPEQLYKAQSAPLHVAGPMPAAGGAYPPAGQGYPNPGGAYGGMPGNAAGGNGSGGNGSAGNGAAGAGAARNAASIGGSGAPMVEPRGPKGNAAELGPDLAPGERMGTSRKDGRGAPASRAPGKSPEKDSGQRDTRGGQRDTRGGQRKSRVSKVEEELPITKVTLNKKPKQISPLTSATLSAVLAVTVTLLWVSFKDVQHQAQQAKSTIEKVGPNRPVTVTVKAPPTLRALPETSVTELRSPMEFNEPLPSSANFATSRKNNTLPPPSPNPQAAISNGQIGIGTAGATTKGSASGTPPGGTSSGGTSAGGSLGGSLGSGPAAATTAASPSKPAASSAKAQKVASAAAGSAQPQPRIVPPMYPSQKPRMPVSIPDPSTQQGWWGFFGNNNQNQQGQQTANQQGQQASNQQQPHQPNPAQSASNPQLQAQTPQMHAQPGGAGKAAGGAQPQGIQFMQGFGQGQWQQAQELGQPSAGAGQSSSQQGGQLQSMMAQQQSLAAKPKASASGPSGHASPGASGGHAAAQGSGQPQSQAQSAANTSGGPTSAEAVELNNAAVRLIRNEPDAAIQKLQQALRLDPHYTKARQNLGKAYLNYAIKLHNAGQLNEAENYYRQSLDSLLKTYGKGSAEHGAAVSSYANMLRQANRQAEADRLEN